jgi:hypothetical protein
MESSPLFRTESSPDLAALLQLARAALDHEELLEFLNQLASTEQAGQEVAA